MLNSESVAPLPQEGNANFEFVWLNEQIIMNLVPLAKAWWKFS